MIVGCLWCDVTRSSFAGTILSLVFCVIISLCIQGLELQPPSSVIFRNHHLEPMRAPTQSGPPKQR